MASTKTYRALEAFTYGDPKGGKKLVQQGDICAAGVVKGREHLFEEVKATEPTAGTGRDQARGKGRGKRPELGAENPDLANPHTEAAGDE